MIIYDTLFVFCVFIYLIFFPEGCTLVVGPCTNIYIYLFLVNSYTVFHLWMDHNLFYQSPLGGHLSVFSLCYLKNARMNTLLHTSLHTVEINRLTKWEKQRLFIQGYSKAILADSNVGKGARTVKKTKEGFRYVLTGDTVGMRKLGSDISCDWLEECIWLFVIEPKLEVGTKLRDTVSY